MRQVTIANLRKNLKEYTDNPPVEVINGKTGESICMILSSDYVHRMMDALKVPDQQSEKNTELPKKTETPFEGLQPMTCQAGTCRNDSFKKGTYREYDRDVGVFEKENLWMCEKHYKQSIALSK